MQAAHSSKTSVISYESTRWKKLEDHNFYTKITYFVGLTEQVGN